MTEVRSQSAERNLEMDTMMDSQTTNDRCLAKHSPLPSGERGGCEGTLGDAVIEVHPASSSHNVSAQTADLLPVPSAGWYTTIRDIVGWLAALVLLILSTPFILFAALMIKLTSPGPVFYRQTRLGKLGRPFPILKLRTMKYNCEKESGPQWSTKGDTRITTIGRILRVTHIDELPQLWNVLMGEMALIGPRPERPEFVDRLDQAIPHYSLRMLIRPGITGLAQVRHPADTDLESVKKKLAYDLYYIRCPGLWLDLKITVCTALKMAGISLRILRKLIRMTHVEQAALVLTRNPARQDEQDLTPQVQSTGVA